MTLLPFFEWCEATSLGQTVRDSLWLFPVIEATHLVAFAVLGGTVLLVDLRALGLVLRSQSPADLARDARPWQRASVALALATGTLLFLSEPIKLYYSDPFWVKVVCLALVIPFHFALRPRLHAGRLAAFVSLALWGGVAWGGRWIGFSG